MSSPTLISFFFFLLLLSPPILSLQPQCTTSSSPNKSSLSPKAGAASSSSPSTNTTFNPSPAFVSSIQSTLSEIKQLLSVISTFTNFLGGNNLRLSSAVSDCLELLDLSSDELSSSLTPSPSPSLPKGTGNRVSDLRSYLSAALGNQDTCQESVASTNSLLGSLIAAGLGTVNSLVAASLRQLPSEFAPRRGTRKLTDGFPRWVTGDDRRRLLAAAAGPGGMAADAVVAKDGSGEFATVGEAIEKAPEESERRFVIYVKKGVYNENVEVKKKKWNVMLVGDGIDATVITGSRNFVDGWTTYRSATVGVSGKGFIARDLTIENTAGPSKHQAVALRSDSDLSVYYRCAFRGYQDTLYAHSLRQFYRDCIITGTVDFIFGNAAAVIQNSRILARLPLPNQKNSVTAQGRKDPNQNTGFAIQLCNVTADADLAGSANTTYTYLGRPWKEYSRTVVMQSYLGSAIRPEGWLAWQGDFALSTLYYAEYMNYGPGSGLATRVKWPGYHAISNATQATNFTVAQFIDGNMWLPSTGVKYTAGLMV